VTTAGETDRLTPTDLGEFLRNAREDAGVEPKLMADALGLPVARLTRMEHGTYSGMATAAWYIQALEALGYRLRKSR